MSKILLRIVRFIRGDLHGIVWLVYLKKNLLKKKGVVSIKEIAETLDISEDRVRKLISENKHLFRTEINLKKLPPAFNLEPIVLSLDGIEKITEEAKEKIIHKDIRDTILTLLTSFVAIKIIVRIIILRIS